MKHLKNLLAIALLLFSHTVFSQWNAINIDPSKFITDFDWINDDIGYAIVTANVSGTRTLEKTTDGGSTWTILPFPVTGQEFQSMDFSADGIGVAVFRHIPTPVTPTIIYQTLDDGLTWQNISPDTTATGMGTAVCQFLNQDTGFFATDAYFYATRDGGATWTTQLFTGYPMSMDFLDADHGTIGLFDGTFNYFGGMMTTTDGGATWRTTNLTEIGTVVGEVRQISATTSIAAPIKGSGYPQHKFFKTTDNGLTWDTLFVADTVQFSRLEDIDFWDEMHGVMRIGAQSNYMYETSDGGVTWVFQDTLPGFGLGDLVLTPNSGYLSGAMGAIFKLNTAMSIETGGLDNRLQFYPNPAMSGNTVHWKTEFRVERLAIVDLSGKVIFQYDTVANSAMLPSLPAGVYLLRLEGHAEATTLRIAITQ